MNQIHVAQTLFTVLTYWMFQPTILSARMIWRYAPQICFLFGFESLRGFPSIHRCIELLAGLHKASWLETGEGKRWRVTCSAGSHAFFLASWCLKSQLTQLLAQGVREWHIENPKSSNHCFRYGQVLQFTFRPFHQIWSHNLSWVLHKSPRSTETMELGTPTQWGMQVGTPKQLEQLGLWLLVCRIWTMNIYIYIDKTWWNYIKKTLLYIGA